MAKSITSFSEENPPPPGRPPRGIGWRRKILEAFERAGKSEDDFIDYICKRAFDPKDDLSPRMLEMLINRLSPLSRAVFPLYKVSIPYDATPADRIDAIIKAVADEEMPADVANMLVSMIKTGIDVREVTELAERLAALEALIAAMNNGD
jgi:hypothetical protein